MLAEVKKYNGRSTLFVDGVPYPPMMATIRTMTLCDDPEGQRILFDRDYFRALGESGVRIFFLICDTEWLKPNAIELFDTEARALLDAVPDALIVPRIGMHPTNEWIEAHPDEVVRYTDGSPAPFNLFTESYQTDLPAFYSLCSTEWRRDAGAALADTWKKLMQLPYADHIIGCFLAAGGTSEWYYAPSFLKKGEDGTLLSLGHSEAFRRQFSAYLTDVYGTDEALQKAWHNDAATLQNPPIPSGDCFYFMELADCDATVPKKNPLANAPVPPPYENGTHYGLFIDTDGHRATYDFLRAWHLGTADSVLHFARIIKQLTPNRVVAAFYGAQGCTSMIPCSNTAGTVKILESDCIDFLAAPGVYENRMSGGMEGQREVQDSFDLHGKIYIVEQDTRTHMENTYFQDRYGIFDETDSINIMKREFGRNICEDVQAWWFDQILGGQRFKFQASYELIAKQQKIARAAYTLDRKKESEIAFIYDEESLTTISVQSTRDLIEMMRNYEIARIGAPIDQYYHNDMADPNMPSYKLYVFCNVLVATEAEREVIRAKLKKDHAVAVWLYAPGFVDPDAQKTMSTEHMAALTGMHFAVDYQNRDAALRFDATAHPLSQGLDTREVHGKFRRVRTMAFNPPPPNGFWQPRLFPRFYVDDPAATPLAHFATVGQTAVAVKECDGFTSVYYGSKFICAELVRHLARYAGCHIYCESDDVTYIHKNYLTLHSCARGEKTVHFPYPVDVWEVYEDKCYAKGVTSLTFDTYYGETKMFCTVKKK